MDEIKSITIKIEDGGIDPSLYRNQNEISELKQKLFDTDYKIIKFSERLLTCTSTSELFDLIENSKNEMAEIVENRSSWRSKINELEEINNGY